MTSVLDKIKSTRKEREKKERRTEKVEGVYKKWNVGKKGNRVRLVGEFFHQKVHFATGRGKALFVDDPKTAQGYPLNVVSCLDWVDEADVNEADRTCPFCKIMRFASDKREKYRRRALAATSTKEKNKYKKLQEKWHKVVSNFYPTESYKWNIIDRDDPFVIVEDDDGDKKKKRSLKIASFCNEAYLEIEDIFEQYRDITDKKIGMDIVVGVTEVGGRNKYKVNVVVEDGIPVKSPLTKKELALKQHDLSALDRKVLPDEILANLRDEYLEFIGEERPSLDEIGDGGKDDDDDDDVLDDDDDDNDVPEDDDDDDNDVPEDDDDDDDDVPEDDEDDDDDVPEDDEDDDDDVPEDDDDDDDDDDVPEDDDDDDDDDDEAPEDDDDDDDEAPEDDDDDDVLDDDESPCMGEYDAKHPECKKCESKAECKKQTLAKSKKKRKGRVAKKTS